MRCSKCGTENRDVARFCDGCGALLAAEPKQTAPQPQSSTSEPTLAAQSGGLALEGERKVLTALFADIKGATALMADLDPEEAQAIIDPALRLMIGAVNRYDGYVVQSTGDGIFALFGAPLTHEDHPRRALYAALEIQQEMRSLGARPGAGDTAAVQARVGVDTGEVVLREVRTSKGRSEYTPIGHTANLASRLQTVAPPGSIAASAATRRLCEGYFTFQALGPVPIRGISQPLEVFEVTGLGPLRRRLEESARRGLSPFVGRADEIEQMTRALELVKSGHGQIVAAVGEPGVGKSRLFHEFKAIAQDGCLVLEGFSVSHGKASSWLPIIEVLNRYFAIGAQDDFEARREKIRDRMTALEPGLMDMIPYLAALLGAGEKDGAAGNPPADAQGEKQRTLEALKQLVLRESLNQPVVVVFEDLHWIDAETQAFLDLLADAIASARVLMLVNYRPEYHHQWNSKSCYTQVRLEPLPENTAAEMLDSILGGGNGALAELRRIIVAKADGNPFFIEEIVQSLLENGVLVRNGSITLKQPLGQVQIPPTVQAVLAARIDLLRPDAKELLQTLSIIGKKFPLSVVREVAAHQDAELRRRLEELRRGEFIYEQPAFPDPEYTFKHALTQEVAYNSLLIARRKVMHERTADTLLKLFAEHHAEQYAEIARHYRLSDNAEKAVIYSIRAGETAQAKFAFQEATLHWEAALELERKGAGNRERRAEVLCLLGAAFTDAPKETRRAYLDEALALYLQLGRNEMAARTHVMLARHWNSPPNTDVTRALDHLRSAEQLLGERSDRAAMGLAYVESAYASLWLVRPRQALDAARRALAIGQMVGDRRLEAHARAWLGCCLWSLGHLGEGFAQMELACRMVDELNEPEPATIQLGFCEMCLLDFQACRELFRKELAHPRAANNEGYRASLLGMLGMLNLYLGDIAEIRAALDRFPHFAVFISPLLQVADGDFQNAAARAQQDVELARREGRLENVCTMTPGLVGLWLILGRVADAERVLREMLAIAERGEHAPFELQARQMLASVCLMTGRLPEARLHLARCREIVSAGEDWRGSAGMEELTEAAVAAAGGDSEQGDAHFERAIEALRRYNLPLFEAQALMAWGAALTPSSTTGAREKFDAAIEIFRHHGYGQGWIDLAVASRDGIR